MRDCPLKSFHSTFSTRTHLAEIQQSDTGQKEHGRLHESGERTIHRRFRNSCQQLETTVGYTTGERFFYALLFYTDHGTGDGQGYLRDESITGPEHGL